MADAEMTLRIVTPEGVLLDSTPVSAVTLPTSEGEMGVLRNHAPMAAALRSGVLHYRHTDRVGYIAVSGGFAEISANQVIVLADTAEPAEKIDVERAREARERARRRLDGRSQDVDRARAEAALQRSLTRLKAASKSHDSGADNNNN